MLPNDIFVLALVEVFVMLGLKVEADLGTAANCLAEVGSDGESATSGTLGQRLKSKLNEVQGLERDVSTLLNARSL